MSKKVQTFLDVVDGTNIAVVKFREKGSRGLLNLGKFASDLGVAVHKAARTVLTAHSQISHVVLGKHDESLTIYHDGLDVNVLVAVLQAVLLCAEWGDSLADSVVIRYVSEEQAG